MHIISGIIWQTILITKYNKSYAYKMIQVTYICTYMYLFGWLKAHSWAAHVGHAFLQAYSLLIQTNTAHESRADRGFINLFARANSHFKLTKLSQHSQIRLLWAGASSVYINTLSTSLSRLKIFSRFRSIELLQWEVKNVEMLEN